MIRKVIYKGVILFLFPGFLYSQWWSSNLNDATAFNNGRHIQIIPDDYPFNHIVYHTYESGLYEGHYVVYDCVYQFTHYNMVINSSENVAYPSIAVAPYDYPNGPFAAIAYLTGSLDSHPEILVPTGTPRVALCFFPDEGPTWQYLDIPIVGVAGVPSIELIGAAITDGEGDTPEWAPIFLVTFARYNVCVTPYTYSVELWEIKVGRHPDGSPDPHAYELLEIDEGTSPVSNPSSAVFPYYSGDAIAGWYFHTVWDGGSIRYAVSTMPSSNPEEDVELIGVVTLETGS